jgi:hypothetical protein
MMPEYAGAHIFILITIFYFFSLPSFLSSIPLFNSKRTLKPAFTKLGGQEGHQKNKEGESERFFFFIFIFSYNPFFLSTFHDVCLWGRAWSGFYWLFCFLFVFISSIIFVSRDERVRFGGILNKTKLRVNRRKERQK